MVTAELASRTLCEPPVTWTSEGSWQDLWPPSKCSSHSGHPGGWEMRSHRLEVPQTAKTLSPHTVQVHTQKT